MKFIILLAIDIAFITRISSLMRTNQMRCHKRKDRCLKLMRDKSWRVCTRCLFMNIGIITFPFIYLLIDRYELNFVSGIIIFGILQVPMLIDGITQNKKLRTSNNLLRAITGIISGVGLSILICSLLLFGGY